MPIVGPAAVLDCYSLLRRDLDTTSLRRRQLAARRQQTRYLPELRCGPAQPNGKRSRNWHFPLQAPIVGPSAVLDCYRSATRFSVAISTRHRHDGDPLQTRCVPEPRCGPLQPNGKRSHNWHLPLQVPIVGLSAVLDCYWSTTRFRHFLFTTASDRHPLLSPSRDAAECSRTAKGPTIGTFLCKCQLWDFLPLPIFLSPKYCLAWNGLSAEADTAASVGCVDWTAASGADVP